MKALFLKEFKQGRPLLFFAAGLALVIAAAMGCLISCATTANPRPKSPARAASIVAFNAKRFVCCETLVIT